MNKDKFLSILRRVIRENGVSHHFKILCILLTGRLELKV